MIFFAGVDTFEPGSLDSAKASPAAAAALLLSLSSSVAGLVFVFSSELVLEEVAVSDVASGVPDFSCNEKENKTLSKKSPNCRRCSRTDSLTDLTLGLLFFFVIVVIE